MCVCHIMPPHILRHVAKHGKPDHRSAAVHTLALDSTHRTRRAVMQAAIPQHPRTANMVQPHRTVYTAHNQEMLPGTIARSEGQVICKDEAADLVYDHAGAVFAFYREAFQRNSISNNGDPINAVVHFGVGYDNAVWDGYRYVCGDGDNVLFGSFAKPRTVSTHEITHGVTGSEINLTYEGQPGWTNESISDVFAVMEEQFFLKQTVDQAEWLIGKGLIADYPEQALRSLKAPGTAYDNSVLGKDPQPSNMKHALATAEDFGGVHINSGIPNYAFYCLAMALGGHSWERAGQIWYDTITDRRLSPNSSLSRFSAQTVLNAATRYGANSQEKRATLDAWNQAGVAVN